MILCFCFNSRLKELEALIKLTIPSITIHSLEISITLTDLIILGHLGKGDFAGATVAFIYSNSIWYFIEGVLTAQDTLSAAAYGMRDYDSLRYWTYVSGFIVIIFCICGTGLMIISPLLIYRIFGLNVRTGVKVDSLINSKQATVK